MSTLIENFVLKKSRSEKATFVRVKPVEEYKGSDKVEQDGSGRMKPTLAAFRKKSRTEPDLGGLRAFRRKQLENSPSEDGDRSHRTRTKSLSANGVNRSGSLNGSVQREVESVLQAATVGTSIASISTSQLLTSVLDDVTAVDEDIFNNYEFPFENLVFEGGGNKGLAYVGALQVLEEAGVMHRIRCVAGASVGALIASLVAVGFTSQDLKEFLDQDLRRVLVDHRCGYCSLLPNLLSGFGWNPGRKLLKWFGEQLRERTGNADITFKDLVQQYGRELCVVVTNLSQMSTEYFHPKTTPNTPIRTAVRMSTAMPGVFQSVQYKIHEYPDHYVDGGLLCNYPIHAFDGWWLSTDAKDSFFKRLQPLDDYPRLFSKAERFGKWNPKTLGIILYSHTEVELMKSMLASRQGSNPPRPPNTRLYRKRSKLRMRQNAAQIEHQAVVLAVGRLMKELHRLNVDLDGVITLDELQKMFDSVEENANGNPGGSEFTKEDQILLFGDSDCSNAFRELDKDQDGEITFQELMSFVERKGVNLQTRFLGYTRREIRHLSDFVSTLQAALAINVKRNYVEERDIERTIGIDTDYIETNDYDLEEEDKDFLIQSGANATRAFLRHFARKHPEHRRRGSALISRTFFDSPRFKKTVEFSDASSGTLKEESAETSQESVRSSSSSRSVSNVTTVTVVGPYNGGEDTVVTSTDAPLHDGKKDRDSAGTSASAKQRNKSRLQR